MAVPALNRRVGTQATDLRAAALICQRAQLLWGFCETYGDEVVQRAPQLEDDSSSKTVAIGTTAILEQLQVFSGELTARRANDGVVVEPGQVRRLAALHVLALLLKKVERVGHEERLRLIRGEWV